MIINGIIGMTKTQMARVLIENDLRALGFEPWYYSEWALKYVCHKYTKAELEEKIRFMNAWYESQQNRTFKSPIYMEMIPARYHNA